MSTYAIFKLMLEILIILFLIHKTCQFCPPHVDDVANAESGSEEKQESSEGSQKKCEEEAIAKPCGQYGFRCLDTKTYEICPGPPLDDYVIEKAEEHACSEGLICDEDNPAYCSPNEVVATTAKQEKKEEPLQNWADDLYLDEYLEKVEQLKNLDQYDSSRFIRSDDDDHRKNCECSSETTQETMFTTPTTPVFTTVATSAPAGAYECEGYGFHADNNNNTLFWYCDVPESGHGYIIKHMSCGEDRIFDPSINTCVKIGTTRNIRDKDTKEAPKDVQHRCAPEPPPPSPIPFSCKNFPPGKYKDETDCSLYHICFSNKYFPLKEVTMSCPHNMAFDAFMKKCTHKNGKRCSKPSPCAKPTPIPCPKSTTTKCTTTTPKCTTTKKCPKKTTTTTTTTMCPSTTTPCPSSTSSCPKKPINCESPIRFRDVADCRGYFLCYTDSVIHMDCPDNFKFDDSFHDCMPDRIARCVEDST